ncbi:MAG: DUF3147 family protein [Acidimicrobiales bacterium]
MIIAIKAIVGGTLVVVFAVIGHVVKPKLFAGLFSAAPSIALASLAVTVLDQGIAHARTEAVGMIFGAAGFVAFALCVRPLLGRYHAVIATSVSTAAWFIVAGGLYLIVFA